MPDKFKVFRCSNLHQRLSDVDKRPDHGPIPPQGETRDGMLLTDRDPTEFGWIRAGGELYCSECAEEVRVKLPVAHLLMKPTEIFSVENGFSPALTEIVAMMERGEDPLKNKRVLDWIKTGKMPDDKS